MKFILNLILFVYCSILNGIDTEIISKYGALQSQTQQLHQHDVLNNLKQLNELPPRSEQTNIAGILIQILPDGKILCDGYICTEKTERCIVNVKSSKDNIHIIRQRLCLDEKAHVIDSIDDIQRNLFPGITVDYHIEQGRNTTDMTISGDYSNLYPKEPEKKPVLVG